MQWLAVKWLDARLCGRSCRRAGQAPASWLTTRARCPNVKRMSSTFTQRVAAELRAEQARKQITQMNVAASVGKPQTTVSRWLSGGTPLTVDMIDALCCALGIGIGDVIERAAMADNRCYSPSDEPVTSSQVRGMATVAA